MMHEIVRQRRDMLIQLQKPHHSNEKMNKTDVICDYLSTTPKFQGKIITIIV